MEESVAWIAWSSVGDVSQRVYWLSLGNDRMKYFGNVLP